jgi:hypothetical protein
MIAENYEQGGVPGRKTGTSEIERGSVLAHSARRSAIESPFKLLSADRLSGRTLSESLEARFFDGSRRKDFGQFSQQEPNIPQHTPPT